jgi:hypothetical protein
VLTTGTGAYTIPNLPAPGTYTLNFTAKGYQPTNVQTSVSGGAQRFQPSVLLGSALGSISGTVTDGTNPLGGISVSTAVNGTTVTTGTPTTGSVGRFVIGALPTPATYVLTFSGPGFGQTTVVVDLGPGKAKNDLKVALAKGTGAITGRLTNAAGVGLGGAKVTVGGSENPLASTTLTDGNIGFFSIDGLPSLGSYTLTFSLSGYADETVPVILTGDGPVKPLAVKMVSSLGSISGLVTDTARHPLQGIAVAATDGQKVWPVTSTAASGSVPDGGYVIAALPPGVYSLTATSAAGSTVTTLVSVVAGNNTPFNFTLPAAAGG